MNSEILQRLMNGTADSADWIQALLPIALFLAALGVFSFLWSVLLKRWQRWATSTEARWDDDLVDQTRAPARLGVLLLSLGVGRQAMSAQLPGYEMLGRFIEVGMIIAVAWGVGRTMTVLFVHELIFERLTPTGRELFGKVAKVLVYSLGILVILDSLGISITPLLASLGVGSLAVALALQDTLGNFFSGIYLMIDRPFRIGDFVKIEDNIEGFVTKIGWRSTQVKLLGNNIVVFPNSKIAAAQLTNFNLPEQETSLLISVGVSYSSDLEQVERVVREVGKEVLRRVQGGVAAFEPLVRFHTFGESSIDFTVILRVSQFTDNFLVKHEFVKALHKRFNGEGIEIPFPQRVVHLQKSE